MAKPPVGGGRSKLGNASWTGEPAQDQDFTFEAQLHSAYSPSPACSGQRDSGPGTYTPAGRQLCHAGGACYRPFTARTYAHTLPYAN